MTTASRTLHANGTEFSEKLGELRTLLGEIAKAAPAAASETVEDLKCKANALRENCESSIASATKTVVKTVKEHPGQVALAAVGAGLLAWWLLSRGGKSEE